MNSRVTAAVVLQAAATFSATVLCGAQSTRETYERQVRDTSASTGSGFIFRTDGENPPVIIKLGEAENDNFNAILEDFKKEHGFYGIPMASGEPSSPYHIPVVGEELGGPAGNRYQDGDDLDGSKYETMLEDTDDEFESEPPVARGYRSKFEDAIGGGGGGGYNRFGDAASSPYKYHRDVSNDGLKGGNLDSDDQNYHGSPYTHKEYKAPGKHKSAGTIQKAGHYFTEGSVADGGYKNHHEFDKGHAGKYGKEDLKSHYKEVGGHKTGHAHEADHYGNHHSTTHGVKGNRFGETESHRKGHRTTGYHNVYHKDEYNKEQMFYEDAHKHGKHDRYGGKHKDFTQKGGGHKHGHKYDAGFNEGHKGEAGHYNKGGYYDEHRGHSGEAGHKSHHNNKAEYENQSDSKKNAGEHESGGGGSGNGYDFY